MKLSFSKRLFHIVVVGALALSTVLSAFGSFATPPLVVDDAIVDPSASLKAPSMQAEDESSEGWLESERDYAFYSRRFAGDDPNFTLGDAAERRAQAANEFLAMKANQPEGVLAPNALAGAWTGIGPNPIVQATRNGRGWAAMAGRIGALAIRSTAPYTIYLGGAQGGLWVTTPPTALSPTVILPWTPKTDQMASLAIGALTLAPSNEDVIYVGTGEGSLSGDSYFGNGVFKSTDAGATFQQVSGNAFNRVSIAALKVNPTNPNEVYLGTVRGRGGARRTSPSNATGPFGVWKSTDGGVNWTLIFTASTNVLNLSGVTDIEIDPVTPSTMYISTLFDAIYKTTDGGVTWNTAMTGLPGAAENADYTFDTRFELAISRSPSATAATLYVGFEWYSDVGYFPSTVWKSTDNAQNWTQTSTDKVEDYCGQQCTYDNVVAVDPNNPNVVYAGGMWDYAGLNGSGSNGGLFRSSDGGQTWVDVATAQHPDYHAFAFSKGNPGKVVVGNDGGVWFSESYGGRLNGNSDPYTATTWVNLNGTVDPATSATQVRSGLQIAQFTSIANNPTVPGRVYGGTQDNGTQRKSTANSTWFDVPGGDGGQVLVDPTDARYVYGTYYQVSPYRYDDGTIDINGARGFYIRRGLNLADRSEFYIPWTMDAGNPNRLYLGTYRIYRTDTAKAESSADVIWRPISGDLTSGCTGAASNGARGCVISAIGTTAGDDSVYVGTLEGMIHVSTNAASPVPTWTRVDGKGTSTPDRPISSIAVDRSNYRVAYAAFNGFNVATPGQPGHVYKTTNGGQSWTDISGNLPDVPVNSILLDRANGNTLYIGTDVGPMVTTNGGTTWGPLGSAASFPIVAIWQIDFNPFTRRMVAGTHGRGAFALDDAGTLLPALQVRASTDASTPVGPNSLVTYTIRLENWGNGPASGVVLTSALPMSSTFVGANMGGAMVGGNIVWAGLGVTTATAVDTDGPGTNPLATGLVPGASEVQFTVQLANGLKEGDVVVHDGVVATSLEASPIAGSPYDVRVSSANGLAAGPAAQTDGTRVGQTVNYLVNVRNMGYQTDSFNLTISGNTYTTTIWDSTFTTQTTQLGPLAAGATGMVGLKVSVPAGAANNATDVVALRVQSVASATITATLTAQTIAVTRDVLLVDNDDNGPNVSSYFVSAMGTTPHNLWDLRANVAGPTQLPRNYVLAHKTIIWFAGQSYPAPLAFYEGVLKDFLDAGGNLFMTGQDILDQAAGTTPFVHDYLHIDWDGSEAQNDTHTLTATAYISSPVTNGMGAIPVDNSAIGFADYNDQITPISPAIPAFLDDKGEVNALSVVDVSGVTSNTYKVVFLAFAYEAMGTAADRAELMQRSLTYFGGTGANPVYNGFPSGTSATITTGWGGTSAHAFQVVNLGSATDTFTITISGNAWSTDIVPGSVADGLGQMQDVVTTTQALAPGARQSFTIRVTSPATPAVVNSDVATITTVSRNDPSKMAVSQVSTLLVIHRLHLPMLVASP